MRVALVVERFEPALGGVENAVWQVAHGLAEAGDEVHVLARRARESAAVALHRLPVPSFWQPLRVAAFSLRSAREARGRDSPEPRPGLGSTSASPATGCR